MEENIRCSHGGDHPAERFRSGVPVCWRHWKWEKLEGPAARHWSKAADAFLRKVDTYDLTEYFRAAGLTHGEVQIMMASLAAIRDYSQELVEQNP